MIWVASVFWNEEHELPRFLQALDALLEHRQVEGFVAIVQESPDRTWEILSAYLDARPGLAMAMFRRPWAGFCEANRQESIDRCGGPWVLVLDADEWIDPAAPLRALAERADEAGVVAVSLPTWNHVVDLPGQPRMQHFGDERHWRLVKRGFVQWPANVHATPILSGPGVEGQVWVHHRWRLWAQPEKIARQVAFTRRSEGEAAALSLQNWLEANFRAFKRELGVGDDDERGVGLRRGENHYGSASD